MRMPSILFVVTGLIACANTDKAGSEGILEGGDGGADGAGDGGGDGAGDGGDDGAGDGGDGAGDGGDTTDFSEADAVVVHDPVFVSSPHFGEDFATDAPTVTLAGSAPLDAQAVRWSTGAAEGDGTLDAGAWSAEVALAEGDNVVLITASFEDGSTVSDQVQIRRNDSATVQGAIRLSHPRLQTDHMPDAVLVDVDVDSTSVPTTLALGVDDGAGGLSEVWATLERLDSGRWTGTFTPPSGPGVWTLRAMADDGAQTPPLRWTVAASPDDDSLAAAQLVEDDAAEAFFADGDPADGMREAYEALIAAGVDSLVVDLRGTGQLSWLDPVGDPVVLHWQDPGTKGGTPSTLLAPVAPPVGPIATTLGTRGLVIAPYASTDFAGDDEAHELINTLGDSTCPVIEAVPTLGTVGFLDGAAQDLDVWRQVLQGDLVHISTHGVVAPTLPAVMGSPVDEVLLLTGIELTSGVMPPAVLPYTGRGLLAANRVCEVGIPCRAERQVMVRTAFFTAGHVGQDDRGGIIFVSACSSEKIPDLASALHAGGASSVVGFTAVVSADYASTEATTFWDTVLQRTSPIAAALDFSTLPDDDTTPALARLSPTDDRILAHHVIDDTTFTGDIDWATGGNGPVFMGGVDGEPAAEDTEDGLGVALSLDPLAGHTYTEIGVEVCPVEGEDIAVSGRWQVTAKPYISASSDQDNYVIIRLDEADRSAHPATIVEYLQWTHIQPLLSTTAGSWVGTGWQDAIWFTTAPSPGAHRGRQLSFAVGGWNAWEYTLTMDAVRIEIGN